MASCKNVIEVPEFHNESGNRDYVNAPDSYSVAQKGKAQAVENDVDRATVEVAKEKTNWVFLFCSILVLVM